MHLFADRSRLIAHARSLAADIDERARVDAPEETGESDE
jgi:hypothetical protein